MMLPDRQTYLDRLLPFAAQAGLHTKRARQALDRWWNRSASQGAARRTPGGQQFSDYCSVYFQWHRGALSHVALDPDCGATWSEFPQLLNFSSAVVPSRWLTPIAPGASDSSAAQGDDSAQRLAVHVPGAASEASWRALEATLEALKDDAAHVETLRLSELEHACHVRPTRLPCPSPCWHSGQAPPPLQVPRAAKLLRILLPLIERIKQEGVCIASG